VQVAPSAIVVCAHVGVLVLFAIHDTIQKAGLNYEVADFIVDWRSSYALAILAFTASRQPISGNEV